MAGGYGVSVAVASAWLITLSSGVSLVASPTAKVPGCTMVTSKYALSCKTGESPRMDPWPETSFPCTCTPPALSLSLNPITGSNATSGGSGTPQQQPMTCTDEGMQVWSKLTWERSGWTLGAPSHSSVVCTGFTRARYTLRWSMFGGRKILATFFSLRCATFLAARPLPWLPLPWLWGEKVMRILATFFRRNRGDAARERAGSAALAGDRASAGPRKLALRDRSLRGPGTLHPASSAPRPQG